MLRKVNVNQQTKRKFQVNIPYLLIIIFVTYISSSDIESCLHTIERIESTFALKFELRATETHS